jgi:hypothetical protein
VIENGQIMNLFRTEETEEVPKIQFDYSYEVLTLLLQMSKKLGCDAESLMMKRMRRNVRHVLSLPPCNFKLRLLHM